MVKSNLTSNINPLFNNVLVKPLDAEEKTAGGIYLPDTAREKPSMGLVMGIGKSVEHVKVGEKIVYKKWGGNEVKVGNEEWTIVEEKDILAVVE